MGDIVSLVEKAQEQFDAEEAKKLQKKISRNQFNFRYLSVLYRHRESWKPDL